MEMRKTLLLRLIKYPALSTAVNARGEHLLEMLVGELKVYMYMCSPSTHTHTRAHAQTHTSTL